jgi:hypothetical protein
MAERAWMILAYGEDRAYGGNKGYEDGVDHYSYDNRVANSMQLAKGDLVVMADREGRRGPPRIAGIARVVGVDPGGTTKDVGHCPVCGKTRFKAREHRTPLYRCDNGHEFDEPVIEAVGVKGRIARFGDTYRDARGAMTVAELNGAQLHRRDGSSIRELYPAKLQRYLSWDVELNAVARPGGYPDPAAAAKVDEAAKPLARRIAEARYPGLTVVPQDQSNPGFDILVLDGETAVRYIEVKSTTKADGGFYMSDFQREFSRALAGKYSLLVLANLDLAAGTCTPHWFDGWVSDHVEMRPVQWRGSLMPAHD